MVATKKTTLPADVMRIESPSATHVFNAEEWICVRVMWVQTGQRTGSISYLFTAAEGTLDAPAFEALRAIVQGTAGYLLSRELNADFAHGGASGAALFELIKKRWRLPYRNSTDSTDTVRVGGKNVSPYGLPDSPEVPTLGDVAPFRGAYDKLLSIIQSGATPVRFAAIEKPG